MQVKKEIQVYINKASEKASEKTAAAIMAELKKQRLLKVDTMSYYKKTELLLYNYEKLKLAIKQKEEDIQYIRANGLPGKSTSIVVYTPGGNKTAGDRYLELIEKYEADKVEIERDLSKIDNALDKIRNDKYFDIINLKYIKQEVKSDEEIAEVLEKDRTTISRNRNRIINALKTILFPESIKELM